MGLKEWIIPRLVSGWMTVAWKTAVDVQVINGEAAAALEASGEPYIFAFWHNRIFMTPFACPAPKDRVLPVVSPSRDGELILKTINRLGFFRATRGSSSRKGKEALREAVQELQKGGVVAITPDGPRGPRYEAKPGTILMARNGGAAILPFAYNSDRKLVFNSWDRFMVPLPCARHVFVYGHVMRIAGEDDLALRRAELKGELDRVTRIADEWEF